MDATGKLLTNQFYAWERLGRGTHIADHPIELEPPFTPFFGHVLPPRAIIDDGKRPHWVKTLVGSVETPRSAVERQPDGAITPYPDTDTAPLVLYSMIIPKHFDGHAGRMEQLFTMLSYRKSPISWELVATREAVTIQWSCRDYDSTFLQTQLRAFFPECALIEPEYDALLAVIDTDAPLYTVDFALAEEYTRPIASYSRARHDPYTALLGVCEQLTDDEQLIAQVLFAGTHNAWAESMLIAVCDETGKQSFFYDAPDMPHLAQEKVSAPLFAVSVRAVSVAPSMQAAGTLLQHVATALIHASTSPANSLTPLSDAAYNIATRLDDIALRQSHRVGMLLNCKELATLAHIPSASLSRKLIQHTGTTKAAPDAWQDDEYIIGINTHLGDTKAVSIDIAQRTRHIHIMGATGTGKSTLLLNLIQQDIEHGIGCAVLDPHGDLIDRIIETIPLERVRDVIIIDPTDADFPIAFNILLAHSDLEREILSSDLVALFRRFSTSWGDQMNSVFANAISAFVYNTTIGTLADLRRFLIEPAYRNQLLATVTDPDIAYYWHKEFPILKSTSIGPILTRLDAFLRPKAIRNMVSQQGSLNFHDIMDTHKIVLVKLSHGLLGAENSYLLGAVILAKLQQAAMARQAQQQNSRTPFFCYIDEFYHFITPSMATILSGARKYNFGLVLAHQDMQQVAKYDMEVATCILSNCGTRIYFRLGDTDAKRLQDGFSAFSADDLQRLATGQAIARVNTADTDFNLSILSYRTTDDALDKEDVLAYSRITYGTQIVSASIPIPAPVIAQLSVQVEPIHKPEAKPVDPQAVREHVYVQTFIKKVAEQYGYKANIEVPTPDGKGQVDVVVERDTERIAIEVSVSTGAEWELHNMRKCLAGNYTKIVVCATTTKKLESIQRKMRDVLSPAEQSRIHLLTTDDIPTLFASTPNTTQPVSTMKGYRVNVAYDGGGNSTTKEDIIKRIITGAKR